MYLSNFDTFHHKNKKKVHLPLFLFFLSFLVLSLSTFTTRERHLTNRRSTDHHLPREMTRVLPCHPKYLHHLLRSLLHH